MSTEKIDLDGSVVHSTKSLLFSVNLREVHVSILFSAVTKKKILLLNALSQMKMLKQKQPTKNAQPCLAELIFGISLDGSFDSSKQLSFDVS